MLTGKPLGDAIAVAIKRKLESGAVKSKAEIARHFHVKLPSIYDWVKKGSISKDKLPELWAFFSDVAGPEHWGMSRWPGPTGETVGKPLPGHLWQTEEFCPHDHSEVLGNWAAIQIEPIALSGERVTIGVVVQGDDGAVLSAPALPKEVAIKVMGVYGEKLSSVSDMALRSLECHLQQGGKFQDWQPVFSGAAIGKVVRAGADNLEQMLQDALRRSAHYAAIAKEVMGET